MASDLVTTLGILGSVASVIGLLLPASGWRAKVIHVLYGLAIAALAVYLTTSQSRIEELTRIENQAKKLARSQQTPDGSGGGNPYASDRGFILAALTFFEKYKERFPETYGRAKLFSEQAGVLQPAASGSLTEQSDRERNLADGARAMRALLDGIASGGID
jgi:hypothetical protein